MQGRDVAAHSRWPCQKHCKETNEDGWFATVICNELLFTSLSLIRAQKESERYVFAMKVCTDKEFALARRCIQ